MSFEIENGTLKKYRPENGETAVTIPEGVTEIGQGAFKDCTRLTSVTFPESVRKIGDSAFSGCKCLAGVTIPRNITEIGEGSI